MCMFLHRLLLCPVEEEYCNQFVCLCVCLSTSVSQEPKFFLQIPCGRGSFLLWWRCDTLCTSGFIDDVTFGHTAPCWAVWWCMESWVFNLLPLAVLRCWGAVWCLWMPCFLCKCLHPAAVTYLQIVHGQTARVCNIFPSAYCRCH